MVYKAEMTFKEGAKLGDVIEVRTTVETCLTRCRSNMSRRQSAE
jgi:acyl-CoA thioesterase FadM